MNLTFIGGTRTVTGSSHILEANNKRVLLDCGMYQGRRKEAFVVNRQMPQRLGLIDALVLGHAHIDHSGNIPSLTKNGFEGPIFCTEATADLCQFMLPDSGHIQEKDVEYVNKKRKRDGKNLFEPLYTLEDAQNALSWFQPQPYNREFQVVDGVRATFHDAGHILGSALTKLTISENGRSVNVGYIVDLGRKNLPILRDPKIIPDLDYIIIESTYGGRFHDEITLAEEKLRQVVQRTVDRGGKVIIPSFALERTQEIVYILNNLWNAGKLPRIPVYVDSPLASNVTSVFRKHIDCFDADAQKLLQHDNDLFGFEKLKYTRDVEESKLINTRDESCIIISASGMCEVGRILHHLKNNIEDSKNSVLIVGFMAQHTLGRKLVDKWPLVKIFGEEYQVNADIIVMNTFSAHADHNDLINYVEQASQRLKGVFLVHGEESASQALAEALIDKGIPGVKIPEVEETIEI
ncbi:MBL fold metallo-hydrolase [candidate division KSB1 bacterium]|nr:MBL fold metallo-hydrolase [candidate division KSB1 bacterium]